MSRELFLIDFNNIVYRFHFAFMRNPLRNKDGFNTSAIYGTINFISEIIKYYNVEYMVCAMDLKEDTFRHDIYEDYKSGREDTPNELIEQIPYIIDFLESMGITILSKIGYEADDIIGTLKEQFKNDFDKIYIITADKDMGQLLDDKSVILYPKKEKGKYPEFSVKEIEEKLNIKINQILDYYALIGDKVDAIPGIAGIGPKTAEKILKQIENIFDFEKHPEKIENKKLREKLIDNFENLKMYRNLVKIKLDVNLNVNINDLLIKNADIDNIKGFIEQFQLYSLMKNFDIIIENNEEKIITKKIDNSEYIIENNDLLVFLTDKERIIAGKNSWCELNENFKNFSKIRNKKIIIDKLKNLPELFNCLKSNRIYDISLLNDLQNIEGRIDRIIKEFSNMLNEYDEEFQKAVILHSIGEKLIKQIEKNINYKIYTDIELPIIPAIKEMEVYGLRTDKEYFKNRKNEIKRLLREREEDIFNLAGEVFNINSPKQMQEILFDKLGIKPTKKIKTGYSTDSSVLEKLKLYHPIAGMILEYRELMKLLSGFIEPIINLSNESGYIHTTLEQSYASTGRFSSKNPNMQNIPPEIRKGFVPSSGEFQFLSIDYSQIELRILAFLSKDKNLLNAFENNRDIHNETAMRIFDMPEAMITKELRNIAKIVNFSVIYGKTAFGLSQQLNIKRRDAEQFIKKYFEEYNGVKEWIENAKEEARKNKYSITYFGRMRFLPEINSANKTIREAAERTAVNSPIQGTAADIIKIAIKNVYNYIDDKKNDIKMLLTIHDELLFEIRKGINEDIVKNIEKLMTEITPFDNILKINSKIGNNWYECK